MADDENLTSEAVVLNLVNWNTICVSACSFFFQIMMFCELDFSEVSH